MNNDPDPARTTKPDSHSQAVRPLEGTQPHDGDETVFLPEEYTEDPALSTDEEQIREAESEPFGNDPWIEQMIREADADNDRVKHGSRVAFLVWMNHALRLHQALELGLSGARFLDFARRITGLKKSAAYDLAKVGPYYDDAICWAESEATSHAAKRTPGPYEYPTRKEIVARYVEPSNAKAEPGKAPDEDDDGGLAGDPPVPTLENHQATIQLMADQLTTAAQQRAKAEQARDDANRRVAELEAEVARLKAALAQQPPPPDPERVPDGQLQLDLIKEPEPPAPPRHRSIWVSPTRLAPAQLQTRPRQNQGRLCPPRRNATR